MVIAGDMSTYYVDPDGGDGADGLSPSTAWRTLRRASNSYVPGDEILLKGGQRLGGTLAIGIEGEGEQPVRLSSFDGRALVDAGEYAGIVVTGAPVLIEEIDVVGGWKSDRQEGNKAPGIHVFAGFASGETLGSVTIRNVRASGFRWGGITVYGAMETPHKKGFDGIVIENCVAFDNAAAGILVGGNMKVASGYSHKNVLIRNCEAYNNRGVSGTGGHSGSGIVVSDASGGSIEHCVAYNNGELNDFEGGGPVGIWCWDCEDFSIRHCESYSNKTQTKDGGGFDLDGGCVRCSIEGCYSHDNAGPGILVCQFKSARPFHDNAVAFNLSVNDGLVNGGGVVVYNDGSGISKTRIHNNTLITRETKGKEVPAPIRVLTATEKTEIFNNLCISVGDVPLFEAVGAFDELVVKDNVFWGQFGRKSIIFDRVVEFGLADRYAAANYWQDVGVRVAIAPAIGLGGSWDELSRLAPVSMPRLSGMPPADSDLLGHSLSAAEPFAGCLRPLS